MPTQEKGGVLPLRPFFEAMGLPLLWAPALIFVSIQAASVSLMGESLFGLITGGVTESLKLATGREMLLHVVGGSLFWLLAAVQVLGKPLRHGRFAWVHRLCGRIVLFIWLAFVGPTAAYLSLMWAIL